MKKCLIIFAIIAVVSSELLTIEQLKNISPLITGGSPATEGQFPYQAAVIAMSEREIYICGGTLIKHKWVLTAASCFPTNVSNYLVAFGINSLIVEPDFYHNSTSTSNFFIHPDYNAITNVNNIALIKIDDMPANLTDHKNIEYIGLPTEEEAKTNLTGKDMVISGYGLSQDNMDLDLILHYTTVKLAPNDACKNFELAGTRYNVTDSTLCIDTSGGKSPCGDNGGPMTIQIGSKKVLVGIMGFGTFPCTIGSPALAESVFHHREWIEKTSGSSVIALSLSIFAAVIMMAVKNLF
ncbi:hypothetical protein ACKWTF_000953 [Chironomus riparius]